MTRGKMMKKTSSNSLIKGNKMAKDPKNFDRSNAARKLKLLAGGSFMAAAVFLSTAGQTVHAQALDPARSFQATPSFGPGDSWSPGPAADVVFISGSESIINWAPLDTATLDTTNAPINILPSGRSITFNSASEFTVLNRIMPTASLSGDFRAIQFNGTVNTRVNGTQGGSAWFYSPGGIIAGAGSAFNVGSLVLTTNDIDTSGGLFGPSGEIRFSGIADSSSAVSIAQTASIDANSAFSTINDYVALVAPRVVQGGSVDVNGSAAYVAAEQADLLINNGLFDIAVTVGTADGNGIVHTGSTTGNSATPIADDPDTMGINEANRDAQAIYMVAVPKNAAITMLVGGQVGYRPAAEAAIVNGEVVLSAGYNVSVGGSTSNAQVVVEDTPLSALAGNIAFTGGDFTADISATASGAIDAISTSSGIDVQSGASGDRYNLDLNAGTEINFAADAGGVIRVAGNASLRAGSSAANGGTINILAVDDPASPDGIGEITIGGNFTADVSAMGADDFFIIRNNGGTGVGEDAVAGDISINVSNGGSFQVDGSSQFLANAQGGKGEEFNGSAQAGNISLVLTDNDSSINLAGDVAFNAGTSSSGSGKIGGSGPGRVGNDSAGGDFSLNLQNGTMIAGRISINTSGIASGGSDENIAQSNDGFAGNVDISITGGNHTIASLSSTSTAGSATSYGPAGEIIGGISNRPTANLTISGTGTTLNVSDDIQFNTSTNADAIGAAATPSATISVIGTGVGSGLLVNDNIGAVITGSIDVIVDNSTVSFDNLGLSNSGSFRNGTIVSGGNINILSRNGGILTGRSGNFDSNSGTADALGGNILISADNASINFTGRVSGNANGFGDADLGSGTGGTIRLVIDGDAASMTLDDLSLSTDGSVFFDVEVPGPNGAPRGEGRTGIGGLTTIDLLNGTFVADDITISSDGFGGDGGPNPTGPAGSGGTGTGGNVVFNLDGSNATIDTIVATASGLGGDGGFGDPVDGDNAGNGGIGIGGNATFNATSGTLDVNQIRVDALGNAVRFTSFISISGNGGRGDGSNAGNGGAGTGGTATFNLDGTSIVNAQELLISTDGYGGEGGRARLRNISGVDFPAGTGGIGGNGTGGSATFNNTTGTISFNQLTVQSLGVGSDGGNSTGITTGEATEAGGNGGNGIGGFATINLNQDDATNPSYIIDSSATGGNGGNGLTGGDAGDATGGTSTLNVNNVAVQLNQPTILSNATGGNGGFSDGISGNAGNGGNGGDAQGGIARLEIVGGNGTLTTSGGPLLANSDAVGGNGGTGFDEFLGDGGDGGSGGSAQGGTVEFAVRTGANFEVNGGAPFTLTSTGTGGEGGTGGYSYNSTSGDGGDGGQGTGGTARLLAQGGTITGDDLTITTTGQGGDAGLTGSFGVGVAGLSGVGGSGAGGTASLEVQEGSPGIISLGNVSMFSNGRNASDDVDPTGIGGRIEITDTSTDPAGLISLASLNVEALALADPTSGFFLSGNSGPISVAGDVVINVAGNAEFAYDGDSQLVVGGLMDVMSGSSILVTHSNNAGPTTSIDVAGTFDARAQSDFNSATGSIINSDTAIAIRAEGNASASDLRALTNIDLSAGQNALLNDALVTGTPITFVSGAGTTVSSGIFVRAGGDNGFSFEFFDPQYNATFTGDISSSGAIRVEAGGNAIFQTGTNVVSDNLLSVRTGDDIIIQSGASIAAANDPIDPVNLADPFSSLNNLVLLAGDIGDAGQLFSTPLTPIASIVAAGDINANDFAVIMTADAMDGLGGTISASSISADINNAPSNAVIAAIGQSDDNGLLSAGCVEGNLCLGALSADNIVQIGQSGVPIQAIIENGDIIASRILVSTRRDIVMGADGIPSRFIASDEIFVNSTEGDVNLRDAELTSGLLGVDAAGSLLGSGSLNSGNDIGITVGGSISAGAINTGGELTTVANRGGGLEGFYSVPGSMSVGILTVGVGDVNYDAGGDFSFDQINVPDTDIILSAPGSIFLGGTSGAQNIDLDGGDITVGSINAGIDITLTSGSFIDFGSIDAGNMLDLNGGDIFGDMLIAGDSIVIDGSAMTANLLDAGTTIAVEVTDDLIIGNVISVNETSLAGSSVTLGGADTGDNGDPRFSEGLRINATNGDININGDLDISRRGDFFATGNINFTDVDVTTKVGGGLRLFAEDSIVFGNVTTDNFISADANNDFTATTIVSPNLRVVVDGTVMVETAEGGTLRFTGDQGVEINNLTAGFASLSAVDGDVAVRNNALISDSLSAFGNNVFLRSDGAMRVRATANAGNIDIVTRGNLVVDDASATGNIQLTSLAGSAELNELIIVGSGVGRSPAGISGQAVVSANGNIDITAAVDVTINDTVNANNALTITAGNLVDIQALATGTTIDLSSADINIGTSGQLGEFTQTNDIFIESNGINQAILGGAGTTGVFSLNNDEFSRIQSNQDLTLFVAQTGNSTPDLIVQDLTIQTGDNVSGAQTATIGFSGSLTIDSGQSTRVDGNLNLTNASAGTTLNMTSLDDLRINANGGLIQITNAGGSFGGVGLMTLQAQNIYAMTDQAFADIAGLGVAAVDARLENSDGLDIDNGLIRGGIAQFIVDGDLFIQNTVAGVSFDERRGFTVDSLTINGLSAGSTANIVINGSVGGDTGIDTIFATDTVVGFDDLSTINGCFIIDPSSCGAPPPPTPTPTPTPTPDPEIDDPIQDIIEEEVTPSEGGSVVSDPFETNLIELKENEEYVEDPLIDEPVTGAGNDDLWVSEDDANEADDGECAEGDETCGQGGPAEEEELEPAE